MKEPQERDLSYPYMVKGNTSEITLIGGARVTDPVYCIDCQYGGDHPMNLLQGWDHTVLVHKDRGEKVDPTGLDYLTKNAKRYRSRMKHVLDNLASR